MAKDERHTEEVDERDDDTDLGSDESLPRGQLGSLDDSPDNLPGSLVDPEMPNSKIDPEAPISSAKGTA